ncbi:MAG: twin-arginine translocation signal domain-containing protein [Bacteroidales bacterium]
MKNNRREFIRKGSALAALSVIGTGCLRSGNSDLKKSDLLRYQG